MTLKAYQVDGMCQKRMAREAEGFRRATMRVLTMQLNSIAVMDLVAFGGAAAGIALTVMELSRGSLFADATLAIVLLTADYFVPMRQLGSCFHVAMNGMAASERVFRLLDAAEPPAGTLDFDASAPIVSRDLRFSYDAEKGAAWARDLSEAQVMDNATYVGFVAMAGTPMGRMALVGVWLAHLAYFSLVVRTDRG